MLVEACLNWIYSTAYPRETVHVYGTYITQQPTDPIRYLSFVVLTIPFARTLKSPVGLNKPYLRYLRLCTRARHNI